jgi:redox-sensitive bicupin YhaK (pirin superfamily)
MGNGSLIRPGDVQYMSAGSGVQHSEKNPSHAEPVHLLQIWILPDQPGQEPRYGQKSFESELARGGLVLVASPDGRQGSLAIRQDARVLAAAWKARRRSSSRWRRGVMPGSRSRAARSL